VAGACTMTGAPTAGATDTGATDLPATGLSCSVATAAPGCTTEATAGATACNRGTRGVELMLGSAVTRSGIATAAADGDAFPGGVRSGRAGAVVRGVDPDSPRRAPVSVSGRFHRVRVVGPAESARADEAASVPVSEGSAGVAQACPAPPETIAAPIPSATARPPTRPTWADARFTLNLPTALRTSARQRKRLR